MTLPTPAQAPGDLRPSGDLPADRDPICPDTAEGRAAEGGLSALVPAAGAENGRQGTRSRLGTDAHVLPVSQGALGAPAHEQSDRIALCRLAAADRCGEAVQEGGQCYGGHLEDAAGRPATLPATARLGVVDGGLS